MTLCHHCGQAIPDRHGWRGLMVTSLGEVFWRGKKVARLTKTQTELLTLLTRRGEATRLALEMAVCGSSYNLLAVHITAVRAKLRAAKIPVKIIAIHGHGYRLELTDLTANEAPRRGAAH